MRKRWQRSRFENDQAEVAVKPQLLVGEAFSCFVGELWLDCVLDPVASSGEGVDHVGDGVGDVGERDVGVPAAGIGVGLGAKYSWARSVPFFSARWSVTLWNLRPVDYRLRQA
jgi:hypothetical protein